MANNSDTKVRDVRIMGKCFSCLGIPLMLF